MAKATKKISKTQKSKPTETKTETPPTVEAPKQMPAVGPGFVSIAISEADLLTFANLMSICAKTFENLAMDAASKDDSAAFRILQQRWQLSNVFAERLTQAVQMPEPISRDMH